MIDGLKPYPAMKDSGVPWLGEVPEQWDVEPLGRLIRVKSGDMIAADDEREGGVPIYGGNGIRGYTFRPNSHGPMILLGRVGAKCGCVHLVNGAFWASEHALRVILETEVNLRFLALVLEHADLNRLAIRTAQPLINSTIVRTHHVALPPLPEQAVIVRFLDYADRRIRRYIRAKQKLIKLLEEQKQAIIHRAVTRGLDPNVRLKPSGVEWLGDVPEHWGVRRLKTVCLMRSGDGITAMSIEPAGDYPVYGGNGVRGFTSGYTHDGEFVLVGRQGALCGNVHVARGRFWASEHAVVTTLRDGHNLEWCAALLRAMNLNQYSIAAAQPGLAVERILNLWVPVPPRSEQDELSARFGEATGRLATLVARTRREIDLLREHRTRLTADVVTGKVDVREAAARLPDEAEEPGPLDDIEADGDTDEAGADDSDEVAEEAEA